MKKILLFLSMFLFVFGVSVDAKTIYTENKKFELYKMEEKGDEYGLLGYNNKTHMYKNNEDESISIFDITFGETLKLKESDVELEKVLESFTKNASKDEYISYYYDYSTGKLIREIESKEYGVAETEEVNISVLSDKNDYYFYDFINGKLVFYVQDGDARYTYFLNEDGSLNKKINAEELLEKVVSDKSSVEEFWAYPMYNSSDEDPYFLMFVRIDDEEHSNKMYVFDSKLELITTIDNGDYDDVGVDLYFDGSETKYLYTGCKYKYEEDKTNECTFSVINKNGERTEIINSKYEMYAYQENGFVIVGTFKDDGNIYSVYDSNLNLIVEENAGWVDILGRVDGLDSIAEARKLFKEIKNNEYLIYFYDEDTPVANYYLKVEDAVKTTITGTVKDKDGNPLKNYTVELHSTPRTVKTDENGYFKFENVEEGDHTLTIIDPDGNTLATKSVKVIESTETKIDGDTLYFNGTGKGFDIELKIDGDKLTIENISNEPKEAPKAKLLSNEVVPKTGDELITYIVSLMLLVFTGLFLKRRINKLN